MIFPMYIDGKWFEGEGRQMQDVHKPGQRRGAGAHSAGDARRRRRGLAGGKKAPAWRR